MSQELISFKNFWCAVFRLQFFSARVPAWILVCIAKWKNQYWKQWHDDLLTNFWEKYLISFQSFSTDQGERSTINAGVTTQQIDSDCQIHLSTVLMTIPPLQGGEKDMGSLEGMWAFHLIRGTNIFVIVITLFGVLIRGTNIFEIYNFIQSSCGAMQMLNCYLSLIIIQNRIEKEKKTSSVVF